MTLLKSFVATLTICFVLLLSACANDQPLTPPANPMIKPLPATPQKITLLLPLNGSMGKPAATIQNGFFQALANQRGQQATTGAPLPDVKIQDTTDQDINSLYNQAVASGSNLIVGPLLKSDVQILKNRQDLTTDVLALNMPDDPNINPKVMQFSLSPQLEAEQVAARVFKDGHPNVLVFTPAGTWGQGIAESFNQALNKLGGHVVQNIAIQPRDNLTLILKNVLRTTEQANGKKAPLITLGRHDFDAIFMALPAANARQLKSLLDADGAQQIPVYGTSMIYSGQPHPELDKNLNGVVFCDMPWIFDRQTPSTLTRLSAFGKDAFVLAMNRLALANGGTIVGLTGVLSFDEKSDTVYRQLTCGTFKNGYPIR